MDLADRVIHANEQEIIEKRDDDQAPDEFYTDDLGCWVEVDIRRHKAKFAKYVLFRCKYLNKHLNLRENNLLYNGHRLVGDNAVDIAALADLPENISAPTAKWVYKRLVQTAPPLDTSKIEIVPGWLWDLKNSEIIQMGVDEYNTVS